MNANRNKKTMNKILIIIGIFLFLFIVTMIITFFIKDSVPDVLITCVFGACTGELSIMGWIKTVKDKNADNSINSSNSGDNSDS